MKQVFSVLVFCLLLMSTIGLKAQIRPKAQNSNFQKRSKHEQQKRFFFMSFIKKILPFFLFVAQSSFAIDISGQATLNHKPLPNAKISLWQTQGFKKPYKLTETTTDQNGIIGLKKIRYIHPQITRPAIAQNHFSPRGAKFNRPLCRSEI